MTYAAKKIFLDGGAIMPGGSAVSEMKMTSKTNCVAG